MTNYQQLLGSLGFVLLSCTALAAGKPNPPTNVCLDGTCSTLTEANGVRAKSAAAFIESVGINVHFSNHRTAYVSSFPLIKQKLLSLGVKHVRDGAVDGDGKFSDRDQAALFRELGQAGVRVTFIFNPNVTKEFVQGFPARVAPSFEAYEYPNELNTQVDWQSRLHTWAPVFQSYVRSSPTTAQYPIVGPSLIDRGDNPYGALGDLSPYLDSGNIHLYYSSRDPATEGWGRRAVTPCEAWRYGSTGYTLCNARRTSGTKPIIATETGWGSDPSKPDQLRPALQAKYLARMLLLHFEADIARTYIYQLVDSGSDSFYAYGLVTASGEEKPSYKTIKALIDILRDSAAVTTPQTLAFSLPKDQTDVRSALLQKSDGSFRLILWIEKPGFDPIAKTTIIVQPKVINLSLDSSARIRSVTAFRDDGSVRTTTPTMANSGQYPITVTDHLTVLDIAR